MTGHPGGPVGDQPHLDDPLVDQPQKGGPLPAGGTVQGVARCTLPEGVVNIVMAGREVGEYLVTHPDIDKVSFTGSTAAGRRVASLCGERLRRCTLELGGKSAAIILDDADLAETITGLYVPTSLMNNGQACVAQTRILSLQGPVRRGGGSSGRSHPSHQGRRSARPRNRGRPPRRRAAADPG